MRTLCVMVAILAANAYCGSGGAAGDGDGGASCTGQQAVCPGHPYAACVEVQNSPGHCVDWSMVGATPCAAGPQDCPTTLPTASFPASSTGGSSAACVAATDVQYSFSTGPASPGYCAAIALYSDSTGTATCTPNPCGAGGYCSFIHSTAGTAVVSCMWPI